MIHAGGIDIVLGIILLMDLREIGFTSSCVFFF